MDSNISELVKLGHERADELKAACGAVDVRSVAQLISDLASQLEVQYVCAEESQREFRSADITMQNLEAKCAALAAENAGLKGAFSKPDAWLSWHSIPPTFYEPDRGGEYLQVHEKAGEKNDDGSDSWPVYSKPEIETPATDAFLAEVRAKGAEECVRQLVTSDDDDFSDAPNICAMVAHQLRKGGAQ